MILREVFAFCVLSLRLLPETHKGLKRVLVYNPYEFLLLPKPAQNHYPEAFLFMGQMQDVNNLCEFQG